METARTGLQWSLVGFNTLSVIVGIWLASFNFFELDAYANDSVEYYAVCVEIAVGCILLASAFIGCCGALHGSLPVLGVYIMLLVSLFIVHLWKLCLLADEAQMRDEHFDAVFSFEQIATWCMLGFEGIGILISLILICELMSARWKRH